MNRNEIKALKLQAIEVLKVNDLGISTKPAPHLYPHQWNWDSAFIAIGLSHLNEERAQNEIESLLKGQWYNGMVPHIIFNALADDYHPGAQYWNSRVSNESPNEVLTSGITQPPILAYAAYLVYNNSKDKGKAKQFLKTVFPKLLSYQRFFFDHRDRENEGLAYIIHPWESGLDNSPRWDSPMQQIEPQWIPEVKRADTNLVDAEQRPTDKDYEKYYYLVDIFRDVKYNQAEIYKKKIFAVQALLFNSIMYASLESLGHIAEILEEDLTEIENWKLKTAAAINAKLWDDSCSSFGDFNLRGNKLLITDTIAQFTPLFGGIPSVDRATVMIQKLTSANYWPDTGFPLCSVSRSDKAFNPVKYWRGPVWININWLIIKGLQRYGFFEQAKLLTNKTLELIQQSGFYEYFHPLNGKGFGTANFSWSASLFIDLIETYNNE